MLLKIYHQIEIRNMCQFNNPRKYINMMNQLLNQEDKLHKRISKPLQLPIEDLLKHIYRVKKMLRNK